ncbi:hypothetical protein SAMN05660226_01381 [Parapedobacter luteus]|uniref:Urease accessory protein UreH-like transmembrane domain-containing protein n=1 Tax=Parapedobacter luteus TaxID=623280 RepID=A0A1T5BDK4_9SPHI|nr:sulfite exporter TauE/SafE family protein [Parapedobacter luteus]SKB44923.1 hypothetical protein SAMN05660226_01381 [Parapedobacter luteus]
MSYHVLAFFMGLLGSLHCAVMCGPLVLAVPGPRSRWKRLSNTLMYQSGRTMTYALLGLMMGVVGHSIEVAGWQQSISIATGILLVCMALFSLWGRRLRQVVHWQQTFVHPVVKWIGYWLQRPGGHFMVGMLNGLLPCGMVYMALAASLSADTLQGSGVFMLSFGLGTWPTMLAVSLIGSAVKRRMRFNAAFWLPMISLLMGGWFLLRGAGLDIPYLSPLIYPDGAVTCAGAQ